MNSLRSRSGLSLLETVLALSILGLVLASVGMAGRATTETLDETEEAAALVARLHRALDQALDPLTELELGALPPLAQGADRLTYHLPTGFAGTVLWGPDIELALEYEPGELDDDVDNDGDGLIDEGQLVRTYAPGSADERRVVLCRGVAEFLEGETFDAQDENGNGLVDERGFSVDVQGEVLTLRLTLESSDVAGQVLRKTASSAVRVRN